MLKGILQSSQYITVTNGTGMTPYISSGTQGAGMMRYNTVTYNVEVYDGSVWKELSNTLASVDLNYEAQEAIKWVKGKMAEEAEFKKLAKDHPAVKLALDNLERAKQQLDATIILSKEHEETTS
jgi:hypothetical protein